MIIKRQVGAVLSCILSINISSVRADTVPTNLISVYGSVDYYMTGTTLASDTSGVTGNVDSLSLPATMNVTTSDVAAGATLEHAYLYWAGTQAEDAVLIQLFH
jgi:ribulose kinase